MRKNSLVPRRNFIASTLSTAALMATPLCSENAGKSQASHPETATTALTPYLLFDGRCAEAMSFYHSIFGGELNISKVKDSVMKDHMPAALQEKVLNAHLRSTSIEFSASDWLRPDRTRVRGNSVCLYLSGGTYPQLKSTFEKLSVDGEVTDPLKEQPFGAYGALNDRFGVRWMFWTQKASA